MAAASISTSSRYQIPRQTRIGFADVVCTSCHVLCSDLFTLFINGIFTERFHFFVHGQTFVLLFSSAHFIDFLCAYVCVCVCVCVHGRYLEGLTVGGERESSLCLQSCDPLQRGCQFVISASKRRNHYQQHVLMSTSQDNFMDPYAHITDCSSLLGSPSAKVQRK